MSKNTGEATVYFAMPASPDEANAHSVYEWSQIIQKTSWDCHALELLGWKPRWTDNNSDDEFIEIAYEKKFPEEVDAGVELNYLNIHLEFIWDLIEED